VRKRDELLEGGSEFGGDDDFAPDSETASNMDDVFSSTKNAGGGVNDSGSQPPLRGGPKRRTMGQILKS